MKWTLALASLVALSSAQAGTLYLCKAYGGGTFWAQQTCSQHSALIESFVSVPDSLPFDQQVNLAEQQRRQPAANITTVISNTVNTSQSGDGRQAECKALDAQITQYDSMARQPQSGQTQDSISAQKKAARDRQFQIRC